MRRGLLSFAAGLMLAASLGGAASPARMADSACAKRWWPQPRQNACATGSAVNTLAPSPETVSRLQQAWTYRAGPGMVGQPIVWASPGMSVPLAYVVSGGTLHAVELATGKLRWKAKAGAGDPVDGTQPIADGDLLLRTNGALVRRYVPRSGHIVWQRAVGSENGTERQVIADGNWYVQHDWTLAAFDARTGRVRWSREWGCFHCGVAGSSGRIYAAGDPDRPYDAVRGALYALDAQTGKTLWRAATRAPVTVGAWPMLADGVVFVRTMSEHGDTREFAIEAFRAADGAPLWRAPVGTAKGFWFTPPAVGGGLVVHPSEDGSLYALDSATGKLRWKAPEMSFNIRPAVVNGLVWAAQEDGRLVALDARDGRMLWRSPTFGKEGPGPPVLAGRFLLFGTSDGRLLAYRVGA